MITITQLCDTCDKSREISIGETSFGNKDLSQAANSDGWREVRKDKHLCKTCINDLLK